MLIVRGQCLVEALRGEAEFQAGLARTLDTFVLAAEVDAVGFQPDRRFHIVIDDERDARACAQVPEQPSLLDQLSGRQPFQSQLDQRRPAVDRGPRDLVVVDQGVQDHVSFARSSSVAGSNA